MPSGFASGFVTAAGTLEPSFSRTPYQFNKSVLQKSTINTEYPLCFSANVSAVIFHLYEDLQNDRQRPHQTERAIGSNSTI